ncbi:hypothetical protein [Streptomyces sp. MJP52]|nr:hypothetical protein [Streptomyces sp. MJP52]MDH6224379.1 hypothetical protein [Streptomyces sp. MJP52]
MTWNPYRIIRRWLRDPDYFQVCAYSFAATLGILTLTVGPIILRAGQ